MVLLLLVMLLLVVFDSDSAAEYHVCCGDAVVGGAKFYLLKLALNSEKSDYFTHLYHQGCGGVTF